MVDNIIATYQGNQIASLRDDAPSVLLESSLDMASGSWSGSDFAYDRNGNQTRDLSRGVADIEYNALNLPRRIEMASGSVIEYLYSADGTKLCERVLDTNGSLTKQRDYAGIFEFEDSEIKNISLVSGYITPADTTYHLYIPDHQGNIVAVYNTRTTLREQSTSFYPYGLPQAQISTSSSLLRPLSSGSGGQNSTLGLSPGSGIIISPGPTLPDFTSAPCTNRRLYSAKELTIDHGLNTYDFEARILAPAFPRFTTPDSLATDYHPISPYAYCGGDPVNCIDPTGEDIVVLKYNNGQHMAMLIQNEEGKWQYYSVNGDNVYLSGSHSGGRTFNDVAVGSWDSPQDFLHSTYNVRNENSKDDKSVSHFEYSEGYQIPTTPEQDTIMRNSFSSTAKSEYNLFTNNCTTAVQKAMVDAGIPVSKPTIVPIYIPMYTSLGIVDVFNGFQIKCEFNIIPSSAFQSIIRWNPSGQFIHK